MDNEQHNAQDIDNETPPGDSEGGAFSFETLLHLQSLPNIADYLTDEQLSKIGNQVVRDTETDDATRTDWLKRAQEAMDAALQVVEDKNFPFEGCANVKYPLLTVAALQFHARAYGAIVPGKNIVKAKTTGQDRDGEKAATAERVSQHMSYQLLDEMPEWVEDMDGLLMALPIEGHEFKKSYFDKSLGRNVSEWVRPVDLIVDNGSKSLETAPRITHRLRYFPYQIAEKMRAGVWKEHENLVTSDDSEKETQQEVLEQHLYYDIDGDGIKEPWICTVHKDTRKVVRMVAGFEPDGIYINVMGETGKLSELPQPEQFLPMAKLVRIDREQYFTSFPFLPSPDGGFYKVGFGQLIGPLVGVIDTLTNQMLDAATDANAGGGFFAKNLKGPKGEVRKKVGEWIPFDVPTGQTLRDSLVPNPANGPSPVTFNLLDMLLGVVKQITNATEIMTGDAGKSSMPVGTTMALVEQGLAVYTAIYMRIFRSLTREYKRIYRLNGIYLPPESYYQVLDSGEEDQVFQRDYQGDGTNVQPVSDPGASTTMQKMQKAQFLQQFINDPHFNGHEIRKRMLAAADIEGQDTLIVPQEQVQGPPPDPRLTAEAQLKMAQAEKTLAEANKVRDEIVNLRANTLKAIAEAEAKEIGTNLAIYKQQMDELGVLYGQGGSGGMEAPPGDGMVLPQDGGIPPELLGGAGPMLGPEQPIQDANFDGSQYGPA